MKHHAKASSSASSMRQGTPLGRIFRGAFATRGASSDADGSGAPSYARAGVLAAIALFALAVFAPASNAAQLVEFGQFCAESGEEAGQCKNGEGVAVNRTGAGGVDPGDVYVVDRGNNRIQEFSASGDFVRMWGKNVNDEGGTGFEVCTAAEEAHCQAGTSSAEAGALNFGRGVAIDQQTGNVYVAESSNRRVTVYSAEGAFEGAFGWKVKVTGAAEELQFCTEASGCQAGKSTPSAGGFNNLATGAMAVDPTSHNLWVGDSTNRRINEFQLELTGEEVTGVTFVRALGWNVDASSPAEELQECTTVTGCKQAAAAGPGDGRFNEPRGIAVDSTGYVYAASAGTNCTTAPCQVFKFNSDGTFKEVFGPSSGGNEGCQLTWNTDFGNDHGTFGMEVDPSTQHLYLARKTEKTAFEICEFDSSGTLQSRSPNTPIPTNLGGSNHQTLALGIGGRVYAEAATEANDAWPVHILGLVPAPGAKILPATELTPTSATLNGEITVPSPGGTGFDVAYRFEYSGDFGLTWKTAPIFGNASLGTTVAGPHAVEQKIYGLLPNTTYKLRLVAITSFTTTVESTFSTPVGLPEVEETPVDVTQTSATMQARIDPSGATTTYHFEWGAGSGGSYEHRVPTDHELFAGSGNESVRVTANISGLSPVSHFHFRVVATNSKGTTVGPDQPFETLNAAGLPNNRGYELVSPADKGASGSVATFTSQQMGTQASSDGGQFLYPIENGIAAATAGGNTRWQASRTGAGWLSSQLSAPSLIPPPLDGFNSEPSFVLFSPPDLSCAIVQSYNPLTADTPQVDVERGVKNLYRRNADGSWDLITNSVPLNPEAVDANGIYYKQLEASDDCTRVLFSTPYELIVGASGLYEWDEGTLRDAGVRPDGSVGPLLDGSAGADVPAVMGGETNLQGTARWNAVTPGGALFFTAFSDEGADNGTPAAFMRSPGGGSIVDISQSQTGVPTNGARFEAASADGGTVVFRANYGIAATSSTGSTGEACGPQTGETGFGTTAPPIEPKACDLYAYDVATGELTDLSADANSADPLGAAVQGAVAVSDDGSHVYFAALGQLVPGKGRTYAQNVAGEGSANVYLANDGEVSYVTTLERGNGDLFAGALMRRPTSWSAEASVDGHVLVFESSSDLAGLETGRGKSVYRYSADTNGLRCISCRPDGHATLNPSDVRMLAPARANYLTDRPRAMSINGDRVFFSSIDVLTPGAELGETDAMGNVIKTNVYEWEEGAVYLVATVERSGGFGLGEYLGASASGNDVFIATDRQLAPQDKDGVADVYDVRVDGGFPLAPEPPECQVDESVPLQANQMYCQGAKSASPETFSPASRSASGENVSEPRGGKPCLKQARRAQALSRRAKVLRHKAKRARRMHNGKAAHRYTRAARHSAKAARRKSAAAKRCQRGARSANINRGGAK